MCVFFFFNFNFLFVCLFVFCFCFVFVFCCFVFVFCLFVLKCLKISQKLHGGDRSYIKVRKKIICYQLSALICYENQVHTPPTF